jgi:glycosyltransferase involved in cell wall biosynthesis
MKYSIITVNYNNREGLLKTIKSVINQTFRDFEFIVIDGGSTDGSDRVLKEYDKDIDYWVSEPDKGIYNAMNKGIAQAHGEFLNFMNSGDFFYNNEVLADVISYTEDSDILVGKDYHYNEISQKGFASILPSRLSMVTFFKETLPHQGAFIRRTLFINTPYDETLKIAADWAFYVQKIIVESCKVKLIPIIVSQREQGGISVTQATKQKDERNRIIHQLMPDGIFNDYKTLDHLDRSTLYKLMNICENKKANRVLTICIKIINRIFL